MADSPLFEFVSDRLESASGVQLSRLQCRGVVRKALKTAGLSPERVTVAQMRVVLERVFPETLARNGVSPTDATRLVSTLLTRLDSAQQSGRLEGEAPEDIFKRLDASRRNK
ncbi:MAG: hypothetical protein AAFZ38_05215 [Myxococcota bacterium]